MESGAGKRLVIAPFPLFSPPTHSRIHHPQTTREPHYRTNLHANSPAIPPLISSLPLDLTAMQAPKILGRYIPLSRPCTRKLSCGNVMRSRPSFRMLSAIAITLNGPGSTEVARWQQVQASWKILPLTSSPAIRRYLTAVLPTILTPTIPVPDLPSKTTIIIYPVP
jgi:hypothetical protein